MSTIQSQDANRKQSSYLNYQKEAKEDLERFREMQMLQEQELQQKQNEENQGTIQSLSSLQDSINTDSFKQKNSNGSQESNNLNSGSNQDNLDGEKRKTKKKKKLREDDELPVIPIFRRMKELLLNPENKLGCQLGQRDYSYFKDYKKFSQARDEKEIQKQSIFQFDGNINNDDIDEVDSQEDNQNDQLQDQVNLKSSRIDKINNSDSIQQQLNKQESLRNNKGSLLKNSLKREPQNSSSIQNKWKFLGNKFQLNQKKQGNQQQDMANSSSSDGEGDEHQQLLLESVNSHQRGFDQDLIGENKKVNFLELLQKKEYNEVGHAGSISSSIQSSLNTQNALRILRNSLKTYKTDLILMLANFVVIGMCFILSVLGFWHFFSLSGKINNFENYLIEVERIAIYSENITLFYNNYQDLKLFANDYYDQSAILSVYPNWINELQSYTKNKLQTFQTFSLNDLSNAGTSDNNLRAYLFEQISTTMLIKSEQSKLTLNYQNFVRLYNNAVNQTVSLDLNGYNLSEYLSNDYLYLINENYDSQTKQNKENMTKIQNEIENLINSMLTMYYILWGLSLFVIVGSFVTIYPIMLQSKIKTHESLTMFTFVSLIDVDFYHDHYRQILNYLGNIDSSNDLLQVVEKFITDETIQLAKQKKKQDIKNLSRSRQYKDIDQNKILLFVRLFILLACYVLINFAKDFNMVYFIIRSKDLANLDIKQHQIYYLSQKNLVDYKQILFDFINGDNLDDFEDLVSDFQQNCPTIIWKWDTQKRV
ncbi:hypothetical protein PPERSA_03902 [Pseudocohnilembus persalinus]|uniref:Transmembrane protein n=1 Tax=Pseudocohnilembus persalinus TaxID=266149 RepID=A0A0V0Q9E5_PSEPJ|nr:hypothetical protein PPERSA_03902 [Pseudocohnilembus persalinus]|eukprot:KRW98767.1 hypothetical protein PPERSA_03902 [Pseudocohnilembus persalinus]